MNRTAQLAELFAAGAKNIEVARALGVSRERARQLRAQHGLPPVRKERHREIAKMHRRGMTAREIAHRLGVYPQSVRGSLKFMRRTGMIRG